MKKRVIILIVVLLSASGLAFAQEDWGFEQGDWTVTLQATGNSDNEFDNTTLS